MTKLFWKRTGIIGEGKTFEVGNIGYPPSTRLKQDGFKEYLLCERCEAKFKRWEDYAAELCYESKASIVRSSRDGFWVPNTDYSAFKLFVMSILWRMAVATEKYYEAVATNIGERNRERLRKMLLHDEAGPPERYGFILSVVRVKRKFADTLMSAPKKLRGEGVNGYAFIIGGVHYSVFVSPPKSPTAKSVLLGLDGMLHFDVRELSDFPHFAAQYADAKARGHI